LNLPAADVNELNAALAELARIMRHGWRM